ncbi:MAG TPA: BMP family ABC transporter substrate-binding protein, partial [Anaerolineae bacterium]|nr:BMP family ABC transporter substrate-binding protein [Anaerolineae bacterium]
MRKVLFPIVCLIAIVVPLAACQRGGADCASEDVFCVGFVTDTGGIDDKSFNETQWKGVQRAMEDLDGRGQFIQSDEATQYAPNLTEFASQDYDLVIASGFFLGG